MNDDIKRSMHEILRAESEAIMAIPVTDAYAAAVDAIVERVHRRGGKLVTAGMGKAGQIAMNIATTFSSTGTPAVNLHPSEAQHGDLGVVQKNDIVLLISNSGKTREIIELVDLLHGLYDDIPVIVITGTPGSPLAELADVCLLDGRQARSMSSRPHAHHLHHHDDRNRRCACGECDAPNRLHTRRLCQASPWRLSGHSVAHSRRCNQVIRGVMGYGLWVMG